MTTLPILGYRLRHGYSLTHVEQVMDLGPGAVDTIPICGRLRGRTVLVGYGETRPDDDTEETRLARWAARKAGMVKSPTPLVLLGADPAEPWKCQVCRRRAERIEAAQ